MPNTTPDGIPYCRTCGFTDCPAVTGGDCPRWPARGRAPLFAQLTDAERAHLANKLFHAGHAFFESADAIGATALYLRETGRITAMSDEWEGLWAARKPLADAMDEMYGLMTEVQDA